MGVTRRAVLCITLALALVAGAVAPGAQRQNVSPILILISIDGFRADYLARFHPPVLSHLAADGVRSEGLIPQFPSKTFPNHYTLVTGLRPAHHGIVSNTMVAPDIPGRFSMSNHEAVSDPRWWGGEPMWNTVERQGLVAAAMFWPGSEAPINGRFATYWKRFDDTFPNAARVAQILDWLRLPEGRRPSFLTLYFSDVDSVGHDEGPDSPAMGAAVARVDEAIGVLIDGVKALGLEGRVRYVVVSDHGMVTVAKDHFIVLDDYVDLATVDVIETGAVATLNPRSGNADALYASLEGKHPAMAVYRNAEIPGRFRLAGHPRVPAIMAIADEGWFVTTRREEARWADGRSRMPHGAHGYDPMLRSMQGLFIASGPSVRRGLVVAPFENIHVYDLMCRILGLTPAPNDGDAAVTRGFLE
jgi:predicted AlkP superfamily pyrophosphatase or phosphodiesterase